MDQNGKVLFLKWFTSHSVIEYRLYINSPIHRDFKQPLFLKLAQGAARELFGAARTMRAPQVIYRRILRRIVSEKKGFLRGSEDGFSVGNMTI